MVSASPNAAGQNGCLSCYSSFCICMLHFLFLGCDALHLRSVNFCLVDFGLLLYLIRMSLKPRALQSAGITHIHFIIMGNLPLSTLMTTLNGVGVKTDPCRLCFKWLLL